MEKVFMKGCEAIAEAAVRAGCRFFSGYPITPQNEIPEYMAHRLPEVGGVFLQGESEVASINIAYGASCAGARAMTSSSGPGLSLKSEGLSTLASNRVPLVICNAMRGGPGTGSIQGAQSDYFQATKAGGHGGFRMMVYAPATLQEAVDYTCKAFEMAERDRNPVLVLVDGYIAAIMETLELPDMQPVDYNSRSWAALGDRSKNRAFIATGGGLDPEKTEEFNQSMEAMYESWEENDTEVECYRTEDAEIVIAAFGTAARIAKGAVNALREEGYKVGLIRPITLSPFPYQTLQKLDPKQVRKVLDVEMTIPAQMIYDVKLGVDGKIPVEKYCRSGGVLVKHEEIVDRVKALFREEA